MGSKDGLESPGARTVKIHEFTLLNWISRPQLGDASVPNVHHPAVLRVPMRMLSAPLTKIVVERRPATERRLNRES